MNKMLKTVSVLMVLLCTAASAWAVPISGTSLQDFFAAKGWDIDAEADQAFMPQAWQIAPTSPQASLGLWLREPSQEIAFGIYSLTAGERFVIFDPSDIPLASAVLWFEDNLAYSDQIRNNGRRFYAPTEQPFTGTSFGFFISDGSGVLYSDASLNPNGRIAMLVYEPYPGQWLFAGDMDGDSDYSDLVAQAESILPNPEPATMVLFGFGMLTLSWITRKGLNRLSGYSYTGGKK